MKISDFWKKLSVGSSWGQTSVGPGDVSLCSVHRPYRFSLSCMQSEHRSVCLNNKTTIFYKNIGHNTVIPIHSNISVLIVDGEFFLSLSCQHPGNFVLTPTAWTSSGCIVSFPICRFFKHNVGTERIDKQTIWKYIRRRYQYKTKVNVPWQLSSSSSCPATSTDIPDPLSPLLPIIHRLWQVFRATSRIPTEQLYVCSSWSSCSCLAIYGGP